MLQAIKIRLYPSKDQTVYINKFLGNLRFIYNKCLSFKSIEYGLWDNNTNISNTNKYVKDVLKTEYEWINDSQHSKVIQQHQWKETV